MAARPSSGSASRTATTTTSGSTRATRSGSSRGTTAARPSPSTAGCTGPTIYNQPTAEFYHVIADNQQPYRLYGAQQDNTTISVPSQSNIGAITHGETYAIGGGESGYIAVRPDDPNIVFAGVVSRR